MPKETYNEPQMLDGRGIGNTNRWMGLPFSGLVCGINSNQFDENVPRLQGPKIPAARRLGRWGCKSKELQLRVDRTPILNPKEETDRKVHGKDIEYCVKYGGTKGNM